MQIIFLPPRISSECLPSAIGAEDSGGASACQTVSIRRVSKSSDVIVYAIEWDEPLAGAKIPPSFSAFAASSASFVACETQLSTACHLRAHDTQVAVSSQSFSVAELRRLYRQLSFMPLAETVAKTLAGESLVNVFGVVAGVGEVNELPAAEKSSDVSVKRESVAMSLVSIVDFDVSQEAAVQIRLWRRLAPWVRSLTPGDIVQLRGLRCGKGAGNGPVALQSTGSSEIFLLAYGPRSLKRPAELRPSLSARHGRLSEDERTVVAWLQNQSLQLCSKGGDLGRKAEWHCGGTGCAVSGLVVEVRKSAVLSAAWNVAILTDPGSLATVILADLDAQTWCLLLELLSGEIGRRVRFGRLSPLLQFVPGVSEFALGAVETAPGVYSGSPLEVSVVLGDSRLVFGSVLVRGILEEVCLDTGSGFSSSEYSLVTSQPSRLILKERSETTGSFLSLENAMHSAAVLGEGVFRVAVRAVAVISDSATLFTRSYRLE
jgi:hypothetical protein